MDGGVEECEQQLGQLESAHENREPRPRNAGPERVLREAINEDMQMNFEAGISDIWQVVMHVYVKESDRLRGH